ncbi:MAG: PSD1 and planctomycete cytochrome C domain-containing protein [Phycisphaerales bacterium]|nr:PSD1 and planctomycete cytochrome C domain-containing protein [Phycisphaerales bacterium]
MIPSALALFAASLTAATLSPLVQAAVPDTSPPIDFTRQIRPILSNHCFACHGLDAAAREADLDLTTFESATAPRRRGQQAIIPGDPEASRAWIRIIDPGDPMPPKAVHNALSDQQRHLIRTWIEQGASYEPHWAYVPPKRVPVPPPTHSSWSNDPIDRWISHRLQQERLQPAPEADSATLLRRLTTDLTGLPPTTAQLDAYLKNPDEAAWASAIDHSLASHNYAERMAMFWLDLVRFADTVGYHGDQAQHIWPYRDWVIDAFHSNMPFDQFTEAQLAGDLLDNPTQSQKVATAYNRLIQTSHEGGVQLKEYRAIYMGDRIRNASAVWMGATVGCAQCHDHKYDPYTMHDYYAMGAFFADIDDEEHLEDPYNGLNTSPTRRVPEMQVATDESNRKRAAIQMKIESARNAMSEAVAALTTDREQWAQDLLTDVEQRHTEDTLWVDDLADTGGHVQGDWNFQSGTDPLPHSGTAYRLQQSEGLIQHYTSEADREIKLKGDDLLYTWVYLSEEDPPNAVMLQFNADGDDWEHRAVWGDSSIGYGRRGNSWTGYQRKGDLPPLGEWVRLEVMASEVGLAEDATINGWAFTQHGGTVRWDRAGVESGGLTNEVQTALRATDRSEAQEALLATLQSAHSPEVQQHRAAVKSAERTLAQHDKSLPKTVYTRTLKTPRPTRILPRGDFLDESGELVEPAIPAFMGSLEVEDRPDRLDFARWLTTPIAEGGVGELTARVLVNRLWTMMMGVGLCPSLDDFGGQGRPPVHLELLDALAIDLVESGWDIKAMLRRIAMSDAYRQSSVPSLESVERDPENLLLARQSRSRLPAELVRDRLLSVSGLLVDKVGGPSVKPPQPPGLYQHLNFPPRKYKADQDERQWRRGVYVHWQRQFLHPMLKAFDAPSRVECTAQRPVSNTPLAALAMMNDPVAIAAARAMAQRVLEHAPGSTRDQLAWAMREATGRRPSNAEVDRLEQLLGSSLEHWRQTPAEAALVSGGREEAAKKAAWTHVCRTILNLHETINRD